MLTKNQLALGTPVVFKAGSRQELIFGAVLASRRVGGDTIDTAILAALGEATQLKTYQIARFTPFDPVKRRTEAEVKHDGMAQGLEGGAAGDTRPR